MSGRKRSAVHAGLILFALWPAVHIGLVRVWEVNPWKLAGWGMYAAPQIPAELRVSCFTPDAVGVYPLRSLPAELEVLEHAFLRSRLGLGQLVQPTALARALLAHYPAIDGVSIEVVQPVLNPHSGFVEDRTTSYVYWRDP